MNIQDNINIQDKGEDSNNTLNNQNNSNISQNYLIKANLSYTDYTKAIEKKWFKIIAKSDKYFPNKKLAFNPLDQSYLKRQKKLKMLTRLGVPDNLRGFIWQKFAELNKAEVEGKYEYYKNNIEAKNKLNLNENENDIIKDLFRTSHSTFFKEKFGLGQSCLFNVLSTFSMQNEIGYVQGMSFLAACFLNYMDEESSFFMMYLLMEKYQMKGFFQPGFPALNKAYYKLLNLIKLNLPKIYRSLKSWNVYPDYFASQWFLTIFLLNVSYDIFLRIFDVFLYEKNHKIIYRVALALLKINEDKIINAKNFDDLMTVLSNLGDGLKIQNIFEEAFKFHFSLKLLEGYEKQYELLKENKETDEFLEQLVN